MFAWLFRERPDGGRSLILGDWWPTIVLLVGIVVLLFIEYGLELLFGRK